MNRRPTLFAAIALTATAALTLSACGSDDSSKDSDKDKIAGADTGKDTSSPSPSPSEAAGRPKITFPSDAKNVFEYEKTGDAAKDAALSDSTLSVSSLNEAIFEGDTGTEALGFYNTGKALESSITYIRRFIDSGDTWVGEIKYFDYKVELSGKAKAYVTYCSDESKAYVKDRKTQKVDKEAATANSYVLYHSSLTKNADGVWQTANVVSDRGNKACQP
ncbi:hypothetical protein [Streptomyces sp. S.PB5]|uniref:hypothetical protein n=1 Tax=Streptomyces sp. S.PB5 TaxID=3020844 RepID=UPI0025B258CE|nr:hypothetical protein [Streptomyces sp. S.PB5]MDN3028189.1 hypothetical protein [Streptomyces sp. S.PB5]